MAALSALRAGLARRAEGCGAALAAARSFSTIGEVPEDDEARRPTTPWVRSVISGVDLMRNAKVGEGASLKFTTCGDMP